MPIPSSREQLKQYALRALGKPVIEINADDDQLEDRIDEALQYFAQYHFDGVRRTYLKYQYTQADFDRMTVDRVSQSTTKEATTVSNSFTGDGSTKVFTLDTSADQLSSVKVNIKEDDDILNTFTGDGSTNVFQLTNPADSVDALTVTVDGILKTRTTDFIVALKTFEFVTAPVADAVIVVKIRNTVPAAGTDSVAGVGYTVEDKTLTFFVAPSSNSKISATISNQVTTSWKEAQNYIICPESVVSVINIFPFSSKGSMNVFDVRYQMRLNDLYDFSSGSMVNYDMVMRQLDFLDHILVGEKPMRFNQHDNRLYVDMDWKNDLLVGEYLVIECYRKLDPSQHTDVFNDIMLKRYVTALFKKQWGANLSKFSGVAMLGGVTLNGQQIFSESLTDIQDLEKEIRSSFEMSQPLMIG